MYEYNGGGVEIIDYDLKIGATPIDCTLIEEGFQTDETIKCRTVASGDDLRIFFATYDDGETVNKYGVAEYSPDKPMFTLKSRGNALDTEWEGMMMEGQKQHGVFFTKK